ncbi:MAG: KpsF/GutQ family sugar-phosphate isomerase [bacterium]
MNNQFNDHEFLELARRVLQLEAKAVANLEAKIDQSFATAIRVLADIPGRVIVTGMGKSGLVGRKIAATLSSTGTPAIFLHPAEAVHGDLGMVGKRDAVIIVSKSGDTPELQSILPYIRLMAVPVIGLLGNLESALAESCDVVLDCSVEEEACPFDLAPTASTTATLAMGDALAVALLKVKDFRREDFAFLHPGGALGRHLRERIEDVMVKGDGIPRVRKETLLPQIVEEITKKKLGAACVFDHENKLWGIVTDGDLRRLMGKDLDLKKVHAEDFATQNPKTVSPSAFVTRAINIMEAHNITVLPVVEKDNVVIGIVHMHILLKSGFPK